MDVREFSSQEEAMICEKKRCFRSEDRKRNIDCEITKYGVFYVLINSWRRFFKVIWIKFNCVEILSIIKREFWINNFPINLFNLNLEIWENLNERKCLK